MTVTALNNQTLLDIAIQTTGKAESFIIIAMANNLVPTAPLVAGSILIIPDTVANDEEILRFYKANNVVPASGLTDELMIPELDCEQKLYECFKD
jgi:hypothetical protein